MVSLMLEMLFTYGYVINRLFHPLSECIFNFTGIRIFHCFTHFFVDIYILWCLIWCYIVFLCPENECQAYIVVVVLGFYVPPTAEVIRRPDQCPENECQAYVVVVVLGFYVPPTAEVIRRPDQCPENECQAYIVIPPAFMPTGI